MTLINILVLISGVSFLFYGISSFTSKRMKSQYARWGYPEQRYLIGTLQFLGGLGILLGLIYKPLIPLSSASLMILMLAAVGVRIKINDDFLPMLPAIFYAVLNFLILVNTVF